MSDLTPRQTEVLRLIQRAIAETGMPPTRAEIAEELGFKSANAAEEHLRALARKVTMATYQEHADVLDESPAKVTVTLNDGRKVERAKYYPSGSVQVPMTRAQIEEKFMVCATTAIKPEAAKRLLAELTVLGEQPSFKDVWPLLRTE